MAKKFLNKEKQSKRKERKKKDNEQVTQTENINTIYFKDNKIFELIDILNGYTNWELSDFLSILVDTNKFTFPITIEDCNLGDYTFICTDSNEEIFTVTIKFFYELPKCKFNISTKNETFVYLVNNKSSKNDLPKPQLIKHEKINHDENITYSLTCDTNSNLIKFYVNTPEYSYKVLSIVINKSSNHILKKIMNSYDFERIFDDLSSASSILEQYIKVLNLTSNELRNLQVSVECFFKNVLFSMVALEKNVLTQMHMCDDLGFYTVFNHGYLNFISADENVTFSIKNIESIKNNLPSYLLSFDEIIENSSKILNQICEYNAKNSNLDNSNGEK